MKALKTILTTVIVGFSTLSFAQENNYCIALRGNGQLIPAHFASLAKTIETFGLPQSMAGGSSASISSFLMESLLQNPNIHNNSNPDLQLAYAAFLWKSLEGVILTTSQEPEWSTFIQFVSKLQMTSQVQSDFTSLQQIEAMTLQNAKDDSQAVKNLEQAFTDLKATQIFNGPAVQRLFIEYAHFENSPSIKAGKKLQAAYQQIKQALAVFGNFDAEHDQSLFLREGLVNFEALARLFGKLGDFLALNQASDSVKQGFQQWLSSCAEKTQGQSWSAIVQAQPSCQTTLASLKTQYLNEITQNTQFHSRVESIMGQDLPIFVSTSVFVGSSMQDIAKQKNKLDNSLSLTAANITANITPQPQDVKFGYWGRKDLLDKVASVFKDPQYPAVDVDKVKRFKSLGNDTWLKILSLSPAEPGLSAVQSYTITSTQEGVLTAGGWSDLNPTLILKASGCENVVYVTRRGGETTFATGVVKRLLGLQKLDWSLFDDANKFKALTYRGSPYLIENKLPVDDQWHNIFDLTNEKASITYSLKQSDAVICTNWEGFDIPRQLEDMVTDAYSAPIYISKTTALKAAGNNLNLIDENSNQPDAVTKIQPYAGCVPLQ